MIVSGDKTVAAKVKVLGIFDVKFKMAATWQGKELRFSLSVLACGFEHCLPEIPVIRNVRFDPESRRKRSVDGMNCFFQHLFRGLSISFLFLVSVSGQCVDNATILLFFCLRYVDTYISFSKSIYDKSFFLASFWLTVVSILELVKTMI